MTKHMDKLYRGASWIIMIALLVGYFAFMVLEPSGSIESIAKDWQSWLHIIFVVYINNTMVSSAYDSGTSYGIRSDEFNYADLLNNKIIVSVNNEMGDFRQYNKKLNQHELQSIRDDYLFSIGDKTIDELTDDELKAYNNLKPVRHNIYGFNLPLYYESTKNGEIKYQASMKKDQGKKWQKIKKAFTGLMFGAMTVNVTFQASNMLNALFSLLIIAVGLITTFLIIFFPQAFKFKYDMPQKVILKKTYYDGYIAFKNGTHVLKELNIDPKEEKEVEGGNADGNKDKDKEIVATGDNNPTTDNNTTTIDNTKPNV